MSAPAAVADLSPHRQPGPTTILPRSRRVGISRPPDGFASAIEAFRLQEDPVPPSPPAAAESATSSPPPPPVRSPLRPMAKSLSGGSTVTASPAASALSNSHNQAPPAKSTASAPRQHPHRLRRPTTPPPLEIDDFATIAEELVPSLFQIRRRSSLMLSHTSQEDGSTITHPIDPKTKSLPPAPPPLIESPISIDDEGEGARSSSSSLSLAQQAPLTKRQHALLELLSSERAYASDLALIREVHIPLALGQPIPLNGSSTSHSPPSRLSSSSSSSRTSNSSSLSSIQGAPMTPDDVRIVFSNIAELAVFSDTFCVLLEQALGSTVSGGEGEDRVGALFLEIIPDLEKPYKYYINKHPAALSHLQSLPQTPALQAYLTHTQAVASHHSHAWDIASLLIKPVQRLLKYSLLLGAIIDETPDTHTDKENLRAARTRMEEVAHEVNEGRRRAEVVKEVLTGGKKKIAGGGVGVGVTATVNLTRMKSLRPPGVGSGGGGVGSAGLAKVGGDGNGEAALVERMHAELKRIDVFVQQLGKNVVDWARMMSNVVRHLRMWALGFGKVIGLLGEQGMGSEAFDAFMAVVEAHLLPLAQKLESDVNEKLLKELAHLLMTMNQPLKLLASMEEQEPFHYHLLTMNVSPKNRPAAALLAASTNYLALRGQLAAELPTYLRLLHGGLEVAVKRLAKLQAEFWRDVRDQWADLWEMLRVEGEMNAGHEETMAVWQARWWDVDEIVAGLRITRAPTLRRDRESREHYPPPPYASSLYIGGSGRVRRESGPEVPLASASSTSSSTWTMASLGDSTPAQSPEGSHRVAGMLSSLDAVYSAPAVSQPFALQKGQKHGRPRGSSDASTTTGAKLNAAGSVKSTRKKKDKDYHHHHHSVPDTFEDFVAGFPLPSPSKSREMRHQQREEPVQRRPQQTSAHTLPRTKSVPLHAERSSSHMSSSSSKTLVDPPGTGDAASVRLSRGSEGLGGDHEDRHNRGRSSRKPSLKQKFTETLRPTSKQRSNSASSSKAQSLHLDTLLGGGVGPPHPPSASSSATFFDDADAPPLPKTPNLPGQHQRRDSWGTKPSKYMCRVVHACKPPAPVSYYSFPFFTLVEGDLYEVLQEAGHPSIHPKLPLYVDDGEDCLLLCRDGQMNVGWALASFLEPMEVEVGR